MRLEDRKQNIPRTESEYALRENILSLYHIKESCVDEGSKKEGY